MMLQNNKIQSFLEHSKTIKFNDNVLMTSREVIDIFMRFLKSDKENLEHTIYISLFDDVKINMFFTKKTSKYAFDVKGFTDFDEEEYITYIDINFKINPIFFPQSTNKFIAEVKDVLRHEFEHTTQEDNENKLVDSSEYKTAEKDGYKAYMLSGFEFPAFMHGFHASAKSQKISMNQVIIEFLDSRKEWFYGDEKELEETKELLIKRGKVFLPYAKWE